MKYYVWAAAASFGLSVSIGSLALRLGIDPAVVANAVTLFFGVVSLAGVGPSSHSRLFMPTNRLLQISEFQIKPIGIVLWSFVCLLAGLSLAELVGFGLVYATGVDSNAGYYWLIHYLTMGAAPVIIAYSAGHWIGARSELSSVPAMLLGAILSQVFKRGIEFAILREMPGPSPTASHLYFIVAKSLIVMLPPLAIGFAAGRRNRTQVYLDHMLTRFPSGTRDALLDLVYTEALRMSGGTVSLGVTVWRTLARSAYHFSVYIAAASCALAALIAINYESERQQLVDVFLPKVSPYASGFEKISYGMTVSEAQEQYGDLVQLSRLRPNAHDAYYVRTSHDGIVDGFKYDDVYYEFDGGRFHGINARVATEKSCRDSEQHKRIKEIYERMLGSAPGIVRSDHSAFLDHDGNLLAEDVWQYVGAYVAVVCTSHETILKIQSAAPSP